MPEYTTSTLTLARCLTPSSPMLLLWKESVVRDLLFARAAAKGAICSHVILLERRERHARVHSSGKSRWKSSEMCCIDESFYS